MADNPEEFTENREEVCEKTKKQQKKKRCKLKAVVEVVDDSKKKRPRMRTASDVISRILWDTELASEKFVVGYVDRFAGLVEKSFDSFSWEDLASVDDYYVLAIPKHRIVYFKYRDTQVWNKSERLDLVFGSTATIATELSDGEAEDFRDVVKRLDEEFRANLAKADDADEDSDWSDGDDSSDIIQVGPSASIRVEAETEVEPEVESWQRATAANYFIAIRVCDADILAGVSDIKRRICDKEPRMMDLLMPNELLHVTVAMLRLEGSAEAFKVAEALRRCRGDVRPTDIRLAGLSTFSGRVLYVTVIDESDGFADLRRSVLRHLRDAGATVNDSNYVPHMTLVKLTRSRVRYLQNPFIDPFVYVQDLDRDLGVQRCDTLRLCAISDDRQSDGFFSCETEVSLY